MKKALLLGVTLSLSALHSANAKEPIPVVWESKFKSVSGMGYSTASSEGAAKALAKEACVKYSQKGDHCAELYTIVTLE